jgi:hypothetical protein
MSRGAVCYFLLAFCLILLTACRPGRQAQWGDQALLSGAAVLDCSAECAARGQCGSTVERGTVVLLSVNEPATHNHNLAITSGTAVSIFDTRPTRLLEQVTGTEIHLTYYYVNVPDRAPGWVAGWCIRTP